VRSFLWVVATVAGCAIAGALGHFPGSFPVGSGTQAEFSPSAAAFGLVMGTILALPLGVGQWLVLRRVPGVGARWIAATALGIGLMHALGDGLPAPWDWGLARAADGWVAVGAIGGLGIGSLQALAARGRLLAWTWIAASAIGWPFGIATGLWLADAAGLMAQSGPGAWAQQHLLVGVVAGLLAGALTGAMLPRPRPLTPAGATAF
jgi:hypothetical protein